MVNLTGILFQRGQSFEEVHCDGTRNIAEAASRAGVGALGAFVDSTAPGQATFDSGETAGGDTDAAVLLLSANSNGGTSEIVLEAQEVQLLASTAAVIPLTAPAATSAAIIAALKQVGIFK